MTSWKSEGYVDAVMPGPLMAPAPSPLLAGATSASSTVAAGRNCFSLAEISFKDSCGKTGLLIQLWRVLLAKHEVVHVERVFW